MAAAPVAVRLNLVAAFNLAVASLVMEAAFEPRNEPHALDDADVRAAQRERLEAFAEELLVDDARVDAHHQRLLARSAHWPE